MSGLLPPVSTLDKEGVYLSSRWVKLAAFLGVEELGQVFSLFNTPLFPAERAGTKEEICLSSHSYLNHYSLLLARLQRGDLLTREDFKVLPTLFITQDPEHHLYCIKVKEKFLIKARRPVIVLQPHFFAYTDRFLTQTLGEKSLFWGIQFSFPQLYQDPHTKVVEKVDPFAIDSQLFTAMRRKMRDLSYIPTFLYEEQKLHPPFRLGYSCTSWINSLSALKERGFQIEINRHV